MKLLIFLAFMAFGLNSHAQETRKKIVVLDTGIYAQQAKKKYMCKNGYISLSKGNPKSTHDHGPNIVDLIGTRIDIKKYCVFSIRVYNHNIQTEGYLKAFDVISNMTNVVAVNISTSSSTATKHSEEPYLLKEHAGISKLVFKNIKVNVAAGNAKRKMGAKDCESWPACLKPYYEYLGYNNFDVVGSNTGNYSNYSEEFEIHIQDGTNKGEPSMSGTSQSTAIFTGEEFSK